MSVDCSFGSSLVGFCLLAGDGDSDGRGGDDDDDGEAASGWRSMGVMGASLTTCLICSAGGDISLVDSSAGLSFSSL